MIKISTFHSIIVRFIKIVVLTLMFLLTQTLRAQLDNRIFSFYPQPFYFIQKAPLYKLGSMTEYEIAIDSTIEMIQIDSVATSIEPAADSPISDTTIYPPLSAINEAPNETDSLELSQKSIEQSIEPSLENSPSISGTYANYITGTHWGMLHYNKDNEYLQRINPGETLFGNMAWAFRTFSVAKEGNEQVLLTLGGLAKVDFGGYETKLRFNPLIQLILHAKQGILTVGSIPSHTQHLLPEPMINYDLTFKKPVEYGFQFYKNTKHLVLESWLDWRQAIDTQTFRQEVISFGTRIEYQLFKDQAKNFHALNAKASGYLLLLHKGGEGFRYQLPLANRGTYAAGFTLFTQQRNTSLENYSSTPKFKLECLAFYQKDFSPRLSQPFREGTAVMINMGIKLTKTQQLVLTAYQANKFTTPLGASFYQCVNENNIMYFNPVRKIISARYIQQIHMISQNFQIESRLEPIYDLDQKHLLYSLGLYLKYSI